VLLDIFMPATDSQMMAPSWPMTALNRERERRRREKCRDREMEGR
jgi:hypothetical protein